MARPTLRYDVPSHYSAPAEDVFSSGQGNSLLRLELMAYVKEIISGEFVRGGEPLDGPIPLWNTSRARQKFPVLRMLANGYLAGFPHSANPERVGSAISCVATKLRGRLTQRMVNALATLHYDYAEQDRIKKRQWTRQRASRVVVSANDPKVAERRGGVRVHARRLAP